MKKKDAYTSAKKKDAGIKKAMSKDMTIRKYGEEDSWAFDSINEMFRADENLGSATAGDKTRKLSGLSEADIKNIRSFILDNPNLDDSDFHGYVESLGIDPHEAEEEVYKYVQDLAEEVPDPLEVGDIDEIVVEHMKAAGLKVAKELTTKGRKQVKAENFVFPKERRYPIHDISHARNALARVSQHGTPEEKAKVRAAVYRKYPSLRKNATLFFKYADINLDIDEGD